MNEVALGCFIENGSQFRTGFDRLVFVAGLNRCKGLLADGLHAAFFSAVPLGAGRGLSVALNCGFGIGHDRKKFEKSFSVAGGGKLVA